MSFLEYLRALISDTVPTSGMGYSYLLAVSVLLLGYLAMSENPIGRGGFPVANPKRRFEFVTLVRVTQFIKTPREQLASFARKYQQVPYWLNMELGKVLVLPPYMIGEIRVNPNMSSLAAIQQIQNGSLKGFEPIGQVVDARFLKLIKEELTNKNLGKMIPAISNEISESLPVIFPDCSEWKEFDLGERIIRLVARSSSRVFGGKTFCRSEAWLQAMVRYTKHFLIASIILRFFPTWSKAWVQWVLPSCWLLRYDLVKCRRAIRPILDERKAELKRADENGDEAEYALDDAINARIEGIDLATVHITLAMVAIHTTADLLEKVLVVLSEHKELIEPLRQETVSVLSSHGLSSSGLAHLELMDSVLKETQRQNPVANFFLNRVSLDDFELSNGMVVPKDTILGIGPTHMWDESFYEKGRDFDGRRFLRMRQDPEMKSQSSLVSTSPHHLGFGHGSHSCAGRFFAANEVKILLCHILLSYEWKFLSEERKILDLGVLNAVHPRTKVQMRRRKAELDLDSITCQDN
ncbi:hypothetical protein F66182_6939 [Fusarium sp. NRRL 66182]|nr:hypothetical protein F66182_6939 [Fusarium sp. NRRL 66182]